MTGWRGQGGKIVNVASLLSFQGGITVPGYAAAKGGVMQLTKALANEWAPEGGSTSTPSRPATSETDNSDGAQKQPRTEPPDRRAHPGWTLGGAA